MLSSLQQLGTLRSPEVLRRRHLVPAVTASVGGDFGAVFAADLLEALRAGELDGGRSAPWPGIGEGDYLATHIDRLFGFAIETRQWCRGCRRSSSTFAAARALELVVLHKTFGILVDDQARRQLLLSRIITAMRGI